MLLRAPTKFLTFVLVPVSMAAGIGILLMSRTAQSATSDPSPDFTDTAPVEESSDLDPMVKDSVDLTKVPPAPPSGLRAPPEYFYRYRRAITARVGLLYDTKASEDTNTHTLLGVQYLFPGPELKSYEAGADILSDGTGVAHAARRFIYSRTKFRPYTKAGVGVRIVPSDQLATFIRYENYQLRAAAGFEYLFFVYGKEMNVRLETEVTASFRSVQADATIGHVWAW